VRLPHYCTFPPKHDDVKFRITYERWLTETMIAIVIGSVRTVVNSRRVVDRRVTVMVLVVVNLLLGVVLVLEIQLSLVWMGRRMRILVCMVVVVVDSVRVHVYILGPVHTHDIHVVVTGLLDERLVLLGPIPFVVVVIVEVATACVGMDEEVDVDVINEDVDVMDFEEDQCYRSYYWWSQFLDHQYKSNSSLQNPYNHLFVPPYALVVNRIDRGVAVDAVVDMDADVVDMDADAAVAVAVAVAPGITLLRSHPDLNQNLLPTSIQNCREKYYSYDTV